MQRFLHRLLSTLLLALIAAPVIHGAVQPARLRCEYRADPEGIGETKPRLGWLVTTEPTQRGVRQSAYRILVASSRELLEQNRGDLWDSGRVDSDLSQHVEYAGVPLSSRQRCWWKVKIWDERGEPSPWGEPAYWSMGLLDSTDWRAEWIGLDAAPPTDIDAETRQRIGRSPWIYADVIESKTAPLTAYFRGAFELTAEKKLSRALLAVTADQVCTAHVNGQPIASLTRWEQLSPIDITPRITSGRNVVALEITQWDGHPPAALGAIVLEFTDGTRELVAFDTTWRFSTEAQAEWATTSFDDRAWKAVVAPPAKRNPWHGPPQTITYALPPAPLLRKPFRVSKPIQHAAVYTTALGAYELYLNGARVGRDYLTPGWTDFHDRVQYQTYDVTAQLQSGENVIGALLGDGWYASVLGYTGRRYFYGGFPRLLAQLEIHYTDGTRDVIATDATWRGTLDGPIRHADLMQGCLLDARLTQNGWSMAGFDDSKWTNVDSGLRATDAQRPLHPFKTEAANAEPSRITMELPARKMSEPRAKSYTFDFGQNFVGWVRLKVTGRAGQKIRVRHGEILNPNGTLYTSNLRGAAATDTYILRGGSTETLEPSFTFHGFRYIEITGLDEPPALDAVTGVVVHSDIEATGTFECSNPDLNQLYRNIVWSQRGNHVEIPTDCPQRDERAGWSGDAQFFIGAGVYNFDVAAFFSRWLTTLAIDSQLPEGSIANVAPAFGGLWASPGWGGDAVIICVRELYRTYGDTRLIARNYDTMKRYLAWLASEKKPGGIRQLELGDHLHLGGGAHIDVISRAYYAHLNQLMSEMAAAIGHVDDATHYEAEFQKTRSSFQKDFILADGSIHESSQTGYALAFSMGLVDEANTTKVADTFLQEIERFDGHLATGFIGTPRLLPALHRAGQTDAAYRLLLNETYPSWLFSVKNGATTIWERWDGWTPEKGFQTISMNSFNHYAFGSVGEFLFGTIAGIRPASPGYRSVIIQPTPGPGLTWARATYDSIAGRISSAWTIDGDTFSLAVEIPPNTEAVVHIPAASADDVFETGIPVARAPGISVLNVRKGSVELRVGSGNYRFTSVGGPQGATP